MIVTAYKQWQEWAELYTMLPFVRKYDLLETRVADWQMAWEQASEASFVLESGKGGRYSFLGIKPTTSIRGKYTDVPLMKIKQWMQPFNSPYVEGAPKFIGGCIGFLGYDTVRSLERLPQTAEDDLDLPDFAMMRFDQLWIIDHQELSLYCASHTYTFTEKHVLQQLYDTASHETEKMKQQWDTIVAGGNNENSQARKSLYQEAIQTGNLQIDVDKIPDVERAFGKLDYMRAVDRVKQYIGQGDVFQVNLSVRQSRKLTLNEIEERITPEEIYEWLRLLNPSPYMGILRFADFQLVSASPELLVQVENNQVRTRPIAGTRPRGLNEDEDNRLADELIHNEKERAEHVMLVDLQRNDLGKIARYGTVKVDEFMVIEYYSHVMHIVSGVKAEVAAGKDAYDVLAAVFPGGTITGAPKIRTMEIIEELEPVRRGPYTGAIGWIDYNGNLEFNMVIRTMVVKDQTAYIQAGAGIVIDSDPEKEYIESINKAKALWKAIEFSEQRIKTNIKKG
ncbi:anthranilate synthase component I family protein [Paenibacillus psychroresistens]|uniref:Anthranilate synthase component I family protein n=1 Tax=Paenibacillus psychroresistens TaxID=1778678 RepID=A0A6B8RB19_9BACL|nr:anthranilate synthase component I family protein [Paenibacillus psychroresistens]QGQ93709.1 anthranilate synthase component I family protein [Paenibacillus psychroresistens]